MTHDSLDAYWVNTQMFSLKGHFKRGFAQTTEAMLQSIFERRRLMKHLGDTGLPGMVNTGLSLGGS